MRSCRGRRGRGYISEQLLADRFIYIYRCIREKRKAIRASRNTDIADVVSMLLELCQLLWRDNGHFESEGCAMHQKTNRK